MKGILARRALLVALGVFGLAAGVSGQPPNVAPSITAFRNNLYVVRYDWRSTVFLVTDDGIVLADPLGVKAATWLRDELAVRFPGRPVRWIVHTHHHFDRAAGAAVFGDTAQTVAHREFNRQLERVRGNAGYADVRPAQRSFDDRDRLVVGGRTVDVIHTGQGHSPDMAILFFPGERVVFAADPPDVATVPFTFGIFSAHEVAEWLAAVAPLDFDVMLSGEGATVQSSSIRILRPYLDDLIAGVTAGVEAGGTLAQLRNDLQLPAHAQNPNYPQRVTHIERVYRSLRVRQVFAYGAAIVNYVRPNNVYCVSYSPCDELQGVIPGGIAGLGIAFGRWAFAGEGRSGGQLTASRSSRFYDDAIAQRSTSISAIGRIRLANGAATLDAVGGVTLGTSDVRGLDRVKQAETPFGGRHDIVSRRTFPGYVVGADVAWPVSSRWQLSLPIRFTAVPWHDEFHPGTFETQVGVGLGYQWARRVTRVPGRPGPVIMREPTANSPGGPK